MPREDELVQDKHRYASSVVHHFQASERDNTQKKAQGVEGKLWKKGRIVNELDSKTPMNTEILLTIPLPFLFLLFMLHSP